MRTRACALHAQAVVFRANSNTKGVPNGTPFVLEQATGIEPAASAWEAEVLPLDYACKNNIIINEWALFVNGRSHKKIRHATTAQGSCILRIKNEALGSAEGFCYAFFSALCR